jgi:hypothetical protein
MRYILILLLFISGAASAQFAPTSAKTKFSNGIAIGSKDTSAFSAADTMVLTIARDSVMYYKYKGVWRPIATGGNLNNYKLISDTLFNNGYTTRGRTKQGLDSLGVLKLNISDTAAMLANRLKISDTLTMLSKLSLDRVLINGNTSGRGVVLGTGSFTSSGSSNTVEINHLSGSGIALNITKGGNGEGLYVNKTSGSGNAATIIGTLNATALVKSGGTSSQFLMADGSVNTSVLPSGAYLPLSGGTLTGALSGTTTSMSGAITALSFTSTGVSNGAGIFTAQDQDGRSVALKSPTPLGGVASVGTTTNHDFRINTGDASNTLVLGTKGGTDWLSFASTGIATFSSALNGTSAAFSGGVNMATSSGNVGIGTASPTGKLMLYQSSAGNVLQNIVSNQGGSTQVGINFSPSMTDGEIAANPAQASIYATDLNFGANIIFANKTTGAVGNSLTERMRISSGGNVLIKTTTDNGTDALQVAGSGLAQIWRATTGFNFRFNDVNRGGIYGLATWTGAGTDYTPTIAAEVGLGMYFYVDGSATKGFSLATTGAATFSSSVTATGFIVSSDKRLKNILSRSGDMVTYTLKNDNTKQLHYGYIAQEVEKVLPTTVSTDDKGMKAVNYIEVLVKKVNDLEKEIAELKKHNK